MSTEKTVVPDIYFNLTSGSLLLGKSALEADIESGAYPGDIFPLAQILTQKERVVENGQFSPSYGEWNESLDIPAIRWLHGVVSQEPYNSAVSMEVLNRAGYLGILPTRHYFSTKPGRLLTLYQQAGLEGVRTRALISDWTTKDFVNYINSLANELGRKPSYYDLQDFSKQAANPSPLQIEYRFKTGLRQLLELAGYPHIHAWSIEDFIEFGVKFMFANNGRVPKSGTVDIISARKRGPSRLTLKRKFGSMQAYEEIVQEKYDLEVKFREKIRREKLSVIDSEIEHEVLPVGLFRKGVAVDDKIAARARFVLVKALLPELDKGQLLQLAKISNQDMFLAKIREVDPSVSAGEAETTATILDVFDDIWPMNDYMQYLKI